MKHSILITAFVLNAASAFAESLPHRTNTGCNFTNNRCPEGQICYIAMGHGFCASNNDPVHTNFREPRSYVRCMQYCLENTSTSEELCDIRCGGW